MHNERIRVVRVREFCDIVGIGPSTAWRWEKSGELPPRRRFGPNTVGWLSNEIDEWLQLRPLAKQTSGQDDS